jgi:hypothetical protein
MNLKPFPLNYDYRISDEGHVYSINYKIFLSPKINRFGYGEVGLMKEHKRTYYRINRLVLMTFDRMPLDNEVAHHIDNNKDNNRLTNLKWISPIDNERLKSTFGTDNKGIRNGGAKLTEEQVSKIRFLRDIGFSYIDLAKKFNMNPKHISRICLYQNWTHI